MPFWNREHFKPGLYDVGEAELDFWHIVTIEHPDMGTAVVRIRKSKPPIPDIAKYRVAIEITWDYSSASEGLPLEEAKAQMDDFERLIDDLFFYNNLSFSVRVTTGFGERSWLFYAKSDDEFMAVLNEKLSGRSFPITIRAQEDKKWELWQDDCSVLNQ